MKSTLALLILGLVAASAVKVDNIKPYKFTPGKMYLYDYSAKLLTGIPKIADQFAGLKMKAQIALQAKSSSEQVTMKLTNIKISQSQDLKNVATGVNIQDEQSSSEDMKVQWIREYQRELSRPITFTHVNGEIVNFVAEESEPEWSLNIKKSILTLFHLNISPKQVMRSTDANQIAKPVSQEDLTYYGVYESGIAGICESVYELDQIADLYHHDEEAEIQSVLNVTKTKNFRNCLTRATLGLNDNMSARHSPRKVKSSTGAFDESVRGYYPIPTHYTPSVEANSPIKQYTTIKYNISLEKDVAQIESIRSEGKIIYSTFGDNIMAYSHQKVTLVRVSSADSQGSLGSPSNPKMHEELSYQFPKMNEFNSQLAMDMPHAYLFSQESIQELTATLPKLFESLSRAILGEKGNNNANNKDAMQKVVQIVNSLAALPRESIESMYELIAQAGLEQTASPQAKLSRKMFLDALALTGSNQAAKFISHMIVNRKVTGHEAREMLAALPRNMNFPTAKTLDSYLELLQSKRVASDNLLQPAVAVAFGKMVNTAFTKINRIESVERDSLTTGNVARFADEETLQLAQSESNKNQWQNELRSAAAKKEDLERYIVAVTRMLENADNFSKKVAAIECLAHMGDKQVLSALGPYVTGSASRDVLPGYEVEDKVKERNFLRTVAIYSLAHVASKNSKQVLPLVLPVYRNSAEPHEMRLAAFTIAMLCSPEPHIIESIASDLYHESNKQVTNFVISALNSIGNLTTPCQRSLAKAAAQAVESAPKTSNKGRSMYSTFKSGDYYDEKRSSGMYYAAEVINSRVTPIPRAGYLAVAQISAPFHDDILEIGFEAKGLERIAKRIVGENGLIARLFQAKQGKDQLEQVNSDRQQEAAKLNLFVKMFEQTSIYPLDEEMINQYVEQIDNWARQVISQGFKGTFVKLLMPSTISKVSVSQIGLPIVVAHKRPLIVSLKVNKFNARENTLSTGEYKGYTLEADIEPRVMYSSYAFVYGVEPVSKTSIGTHVEKTYNAYIPLKATLTHQHANQQWSLLVKPKSGYEAIYHKSEALTFVSKVATVFAPSRDWLESAQTIRKETTSPVKVEKTLAHSKVPVAAKVIVETEKSELDEQYIRKNIAKNGLISTLIAIFRNSNLAAREVRVRLEENSEVAQRDILFQWNTKQQYQPEEYESEIEDARDCPYGLTEEIVERFTCAITGTKVEHVHHCEKKIARDAVRMYSAARNNLKWLVEGEKQKLSEEEKYDFEQEWEAETGRDKLFGENSQNLIERTEYIVRGNSVCFTTQPIRTCRNGSKPTEERQVTRGFHCLPRKSALTQEYMRQAEKSVLRQLANKKVEFRQQLTVAKACAA